MHIKLRLFLHAPNVHQGGGAVLLRELLTTIAPDTAVTLHVDERMTLPALPASITVQRFQPSFAGRWQAETVLSKTVSAGDIVLCFGNLPPLFNNKGKVLLFLQNRYLIDKFPLTGFSSFVKLRFAIERLWLRLTNVRVHTFIVQTPSMQNLLQQYCQRELTVKILPLGDPLLLSKVKNDKPSKHYDFIYVASGDPHKNHENLIKAWILLAQENIHPKLLLTIEPEKYGSLWSWVITNKKTYNLAIENHTVIAREQLAQVYAQSHACIYPSRLESFGLPLLEAAQAGLPILASELDFVRDVINPAHTFDPASPISIKRAVKRYLAQAEHTLQPIDGKTFWQYIYESK